MDRDSVPSDKRKKNLHMYLHNQRAYSLSHIFWFGLNELYRPRILVFIYVKEYLHNPLYVSFYAIGAYSLSENRQSFIFCARWERMLPQAFRYFPIQIIIMQSSFK